MSDPVTNVEIEDVLSSIRRLVSDGDKARTRDPAPVPEQAEEAVQDADPASEPAESTASAAPEKLVLTPAFLVVDSEPKDVAAPAQEDAPAHEGETSDAEDTSDEQWEVESEDDAQASSSHEDSDEAPLELTDMVWEAVQEDVSDQIEDVVAQVVEEQTPQDDTADKQSLEADASEDTGTTDRSELVATIAELEAAISTDAGEYEPDGSEDMGETIAWPGAMVRSFEDVEDAQESNDAPEAVEAEDPTPELAETAEDTHDHAEKAQDAEDAIDDADEYIDDDIDGLLDVGGVTLDDEALRAMVSEIVREELTGPLGERITRNVRKLVRREIYRILSSQEFD